MLCITLLIGSFTPGIEFARGVIRAKEQHKIVQVKDSYKTINNDTLSVEKVSNFVCPQYEKTLFFRYFAKGDYEPKPENYSAANAPTMQDALQDAKE